MDRLVAEEQLDLIYAQTVPLMDAESGAAARRTLLWRAGLSVSAAATKADNVSRVTMDEFRQIIGAKRKVTRDG
jgi:hypothetical protein